MGCNADKISEYYQRQYQLHEGTVEENVDMLFDENLVCHLGEHRTAGRDAVLKTAARIREAGGFGLPFIITEEDDDVYFRLHLRVPDPETGEMHSEHVQHVWRFGPNGKVVEVWPKQPAIVEKTFKDGGIEPTQPAA